MKGCSDRLEVVDIGIRTDWEGRCIRVSINSEMRYLPFAGFGGEDPKERLRIPEFVTAALSVRDLTCDLVISEKPADSIASINYPLRDKPTKVENETEAALLAASIRDSRRPVCLVLYFGTTARTALEAEQVAKEGALKSYVYVISPKNKVLNPIQKALPGWNLDRDVRECSCRIVFPFPDYADQDNANPRYRMAWPRKMSSNDRLIRILRGLQRYFPQEDPAGLLGMRDMNRRMLRTEAKANKEYASEAERVAEEAEQAAKESESRANVAKLENLGLRERIDDMMISLSFAQDNIKRLDEINNTLRSIISEQANLLAKRGVPKKDIPVERESVPVFKSLVDVLKWAKVHFQNLEILDQAFSHARSLDNRNPTEGYNMLKDMNDILYPLMKEGGANIAVSFKNRSGFDLTFSEGGQTKGDKGIELERTIRLRDKTFVFWPHVRSKTHGEDCLIRAYFHYDPDVDKILIGFFGKHLRTAGTDRMST